MNVAAARASEPVFSPIPRRRQLFPRQVRFWSITTWLIAINIAVFIVDVLTRGRLSEWGCFSVEMGIWHYQLWRLITFQFLHAGPLHIAFNMLWLYFLGPIIEPWLGRRRYITFYLVCGVVSALTCGAIEMSHLLPGETIETTLVGASGGIFGVMAAAATIAPRFRVHLILPPVSITLRAMLWIAIGIALATIWTGGWNAGGEAAHLGGAAAGYVLIKQRQWLAMLSGQRKRSRFWQPGDPPERFFRDGV